MRSIGVPERYRSVAPLPLQIVHSEVGQFLLADVATEHGDKSGIGVLLSDASMHERRPYGLRTQMFIDQLFEISSKYDIHRFSGLVLLDAQHADFAALVVNSLDAGRSSLNEVFGALARPVDERHHAVHGRFRTRVDGLKLHVVNSDL